MWPQILLRLDDRFRIYYLAFILKDIALRTLNQKNGIFLFPASSVERSNANIIARVVKYNKKNFQSQIDNATTQMYSRDPFPFSNRHATKKNQMTYTLYSPII